MVGSGNIRSEKRTVFLTKCKKFTTLSENMNVRKLGVSEIERIIIRVAFGVSRAYWLFGSFYLFFSFAVRLQSYFLYHDNMRLNRCFLFVVGFEWIFEPTSFIPEQRLLTTQPLTPRLHSEAKIQNPRIAFSTAMMSSKTRCKSRTHQCCYQLYVQPSMGRPKVAKVYVKKSNWPPKDRPLIIYIRPPKPFVVRTYAGLSDNKVKACMGIGTRHDVIRSIWTYTFFLIGTTISADSFLLGLTAMSHTLIQNAKNRKIAHWKLTLIPLAYLFLIRSSSSSLSVISDPKILWFKAKIYNHETSRARIKMNRSKIKKKSHRREI
ncbi:hypothetical protein GQR58_024864 [Nymphon striatum]|nr:hypothetical protein GQR58_024864 [Nymphon striatum]